MQAGFNAVQPGGEPGGPVRTHAAVDTAVFADWASSLFTARLAQLYGALRTNAAHHLRDFHGLQLRESRVLLVVGTEGPIAPKNICIRASMDKAGVSRTIDRLEARGWVERVYTRPGGRVGAVALTAHGRVLHAELIAEVAGRERTLLAPLDETERATLLELMGKLHHHIERLNRAQGLSDPPRE